ncbi:hypothetical protein A2U01_0062974, partial [Trifolium medium]|nr:hypothetical protein [Trifolium medium]
MTLKTDNQVQVGQTQV